MKRDKYVVVIGAANIDIGGTPYDKLIKGDSNPGRITVSFGGVGRNISHNLSKLGIPVKLITAIGSDDLSFMLRSNCINAGIDISHALVMTEDSSSMYMYINDENGDMALALSYVDIAKKITPSYIDTVSDVINGAAMVAMDCNLTHETLIHIKKICKVPLFVDPVSQPHASKIKGHLDGIDILKPNKLEAEYLTDMTINSIDDYHRAADDLISQGVGRVFISMSSDGILSADADTHYVSHIFPSEVISTTGAGDSADAAIIWSLMKSSETECITDSDIMKNAADAANAAASITISSSRTISDNMSQDEIYRILETSGRRLSQRT